MRNTKYNRFNRSYSSKFSCAFDGALYPIFYDEVLPGDKFSVKMASLVRVVPLLAPLMDSVIFDVHFFFVPNRLVWNAWEAFITGGNKGSAHVDPPYIIFNTIKDDLSLNTVKIRKSRCMHHGYLCDWFDVPTFSDTDKYDASKEDAFILQKNGTAADKANITVRVSALPYRAYDLIWSMFYRDEWQQYFADYDVKYNLSSGVDTTTPCNYRYRNWKRDYFTSLLPAPQKTITGGDVPSGEGFYDMSTPNVGIPSPGARAQVTQGVVPSMDVSQGKVSQIQITSQDLNDLGFKVVAKDNSQRQVPLDVVELVKTLNDATINSDLTLTLPDLEGEVDAFEVKFYPQKIVIPSVPLVLNTGDKSSIRAIIPQHTIHLPAKHVINLNHVWFKCFAAPYDSTRFPYYYTFFRLDKFTRSFADDDAHDYEWTWDPTKPQPSIVKGMFPSLIFSWARKDTGAVYGSKLNLGWTIGAPVGRIKTTDIEGDTSMNDSYENGEYASGLTWNPACISTMQFETPHEEASGISDPAHSPIQEPRDSMFKPQIEATDYDLPSIEAQFKRVKSGITDGDTAPTQWDFTDGAWIQFRKGINDGYLGVTVPSAKYKIAGATITIPKGTNLGTFGGFVDTQRWYVKTDNSILIPEQNVSKQTTPETKINEQFVDVPQGVALNINELRAAFKVQRYYEKAAIIGSRYPEYLWGHFKVKSPDARLQRPEYLGGGSFDMAFSEVLQTAPVYNGTYGNTPLGSMAGHGVAAQKGIGFKRYFSEHGMVFGIMTMRLRSSYAQGIPRMNQRWNKFAYYQPIFAHLGEEPVFLRELIVGMNHKDDSYGTQDQKNVKVLGWKDRFDEYRHRYNTFHGLFRSSLTYWHLGRIFQTLKKDDPLPKLEEVISTHGFYSGSAGGSSYPLRAFVNQDTFDDKLMFDTHFRVKVLRKMPKKGTPGGDLL